MGIIERLQKYGEHGSRSREPTIPQSAELKDVVSAEYYVPRKIDIARIVALVDTVKSVGQSAIRVVDLAGGKGLLDCLLAQELAQAAPGSVVVDVDSDQRVLDIGAEAYADIPNLKFERANIRNSKSDTFAVPADAVISSWARPGDAEDAEIKAVVKRLQPEVFIAIGEVGRDFTQPVNPGDDYVKLCEWFGPASQEVTMGSPLHYYLDGEEEKKFEKSGSNLFEAYVLKSVGEAKISSARRVIMGVQPDNDSQYGWEEELERHYPVPTIVVTEPSLFTAVLGPEEL